MPLAGLKLGVIIGSKNYTFCGLVKLTKIRLSKKLQTLSVPSSLIVIELENRFMVEVEPPTKSILPPPKLIELYVDRVFNVTEDQLLILLS